MKTFEREDVLDLDITLAEIIHDGLVKYVEENDSSHPGDLSPEQWEATLAGMIEAFSNLPDEYGAYTEATQKGVNDFARYLRCLWI